MSTLTRGQCLGMIADCDGSMPDYLALAIIWGARDPYPTDADAFEAFLCDYVTACALTDAVRSNGPKDSDDTGIPI